VFGKKGDTMSKIGRLPIPFSSAKIEIKKNIIEINGPKAKFAHELPEAIKASVEDEKSLKLDVAEKTRKNKMLWGLHRALLANKVQGAERGFEKKVSIVGLGYKAVLAGKKMTFSLGYSNKIEYELPDGVSVKIDKSGQQLVFESTDKFLLGSVCDKVRSFRHPEPYKGTGVIREGDIIIRKAGKAKAA